jgi:hypothetical protein
MVGYIGVTSEAWSQLPVVFANDGQSWVGARVFLYSHIYHNQPQARTWAGHHIKYQKIDRERLLVFLFFWIPF